jgi:uncharacterized protein (TIGR02145 family)
LQAQVRIGGTTDPAPGAILDLNSTAKGGLLLSNVTLTSLRTIPGEIYDAATINTDTTKKAALKGAMVYHTGGNDIPAGVYIWDGKRWNPPGGAPENTVKDAEGNKYTIGDFGDAGIWMTQNLQTTTGLTKFESGSAPATTSYYTYPNKSQSTFENNPHYGLLYNWAAASGRPGGDNVVDSEGVGKTPPGTTPYRGICPQGWHLPSDYEWSQLEKEIATNPGNYSSQTVAYGNWNDSTSFFPISGDFGRRPIINGGSNIDTNWGRQMKSTTPVNGTTTNGSSKTREDDGFDALLIGCVNGSGGVEGYGQHANFWSSSSNSSSGIYRYLEYNYTSVNRQNQYKYYLFSVRCKKD